MYNLIDYILLLGVSAACIQGWMMNEWMNDLNIHKYVYMSL